MRILWLGLFLLLPACFTDVGGMGEPCNDRDVCLGELYCLDNTCQDLSAVREAYCSTDCAAGSGVVNGFDCSLCRGAPTDDAGE